MKKFINNLFIWVGIVFKVLPVAEQIKDLIVVAAEVIKEEKKATSVKSGGVKKFNVVKTLAKKLPGTDTGDVVDGAVSVLKGLGVL
jgi:hypothetical protein